MNSRSILLRSALALLLSAAVPASLSYVAPPALAQAGGEVAAALAADPAQLDNKALRQQIKTLREAIQSGSLSGQERKKAREKIQALREVLKQRRGGAEETEAAAQADSQETGQRKEQRQKPQQAKQQQAEEQVQGGSKEATEQPASRKERPQQAQAQQGGGVSPEVQSLLAEGREPSQLDEQELRTNIKGLRTAIQSGALSNEQRKQARERLRAYRDELKSRRTQAAGKPERKERQTEAAASEEAPQAAPSAKAEALISDDRQPKELSEKELRNRLSETRQVLQSGKLSKAEQRALRERLRADRQAVRQRVAKEQEEEQQEPEAGDTTEVSTNVNVIIEQPAPRDRLSERQLNRRIRALERAVKEQRLEQRRLEIANRILQEDRRELRERLKRQRERRRQELREARARDQLIIDFHIGYQPPPVIFAAEADYQAIEHQLVAPPRYRPQRAYQLQEIVANPEIRQAMPGIEIDTLNFDFGSAEVRPEEVDKLDRIAEVIERIVIERPDEVFMIEGHTDAVGSDAANLALSQARAEAVASALVDYYAIDPENLRPVGLGERFLRIPTPEPEEENRRVTVRRITPLLTGQAG